MLVIPKDGGIELLFADRFLADRFLAARFTS